MDRINEIPYLQFPQEWQVKVIPNGQADARFFVKLPEMESRISIYLDFDGKLGYYGYGNNTKPYWEVYPTEEGDTARFHIDDTKGLLDKIQAILDDWKEKNKVKLSPLYRTLND